MAYEQRNCEDAEKPGPSADETLRGLDPPLTRCGLDPPLTRSFLAASPLQGRGVVAFGAVRGTPSTRGGERVGVRGTHRPSVVLRVDTSKDEKFFTLPHRGGIGPLENVLALERRIG